MRNVKLFYTTIFILLIITLYGQERERYFEIESLLENGSVVFLKGDRGVYYVPLNTYKDSIKLNVTKNDNSAILLNSINPLIYDSLTNFDIYTSQTTFSSRKNIDIASTGMCSELFLGIFFYDLELKGIDTIWGDELPNDFFYNDTIKYFKIFAFNISSKLLRYDKYFKNDTVKITIDYSFPSFTYTLIENIEVQKKMIKKPYWYNFRKKRTVEGYIEKR